MERGLLVSYSSSSSEEDSCNFATVGNKQHSKRACTEDDITCNIKRIAGEKFSEISRLPVPSGVLNMFKDEETENQENDPSKHQGRIRTFAHQRGNWATFVYVPYDETERLMELTNSLITCLRPQGEFVPVQDVHMSLSQTFPIRHHWIESLVKTLRDNVGSCYRCICDISTVAFYASDELSRTFLALKVDVGFEELQSYVGRIDKALQEYRLPQYYKNPSFHISIAWALGDIRKLITSDTMDRLQSLADTFFNENPDLGQVEVDELHCKTGNKVFNLQLRDKRQCTS
ncbi:U6 snRNA phosphodiesterase [Lamellibrachia satsuma]|nr:U6 snRNA phosphodiesterase [Lamellibrachia satsuma]